MTKQDVSERMPARKSHFLGLVYSISNWGYSSWNTHQWFCPESCIKHLGLIGSFLSLQWPEDAAEETLRPKILSITIGLSKRKMYPNVLFEILIDSSNTSCIPNSTFIWCRITSENKYAWALISPCHSICTFAEVGIAGPVWRDKNSGNTQIRSNGPA